MSQMLVVDDHDDDDDDDDDDEDDDDDDDDNDKDDNDDDDEDEDVNVNVVHLYSVMCILVNHLYSAPSQGRLWQCRLGFEHDTLPPFP